MGLARTLRYRKIDTTVLKDADVSHKVIKKYRCNFKLNN